MNIEKENPRKEKNKQLLQLINQDISDPKLKKILKMIVKGDD